MNEFDGKLLGVVRLIFPSGNRHEPAPVVSCVSSPSRLQAVKSDSPEGGLDHPPISTQAMDAPDPSAIEAIGQEHNIAQIGTMSEEEWLEKVYKGDSYPQLTLRAIAMGAALGSLMSIANLYTMVKIGWGFGVAITCCVLSYVIWNGLRIVFPKLSPMTILENNCMQSTASAAGYSTGSTVGTAFGALLLITGVHTSWQVLLPWTFVTAMLGAFLAVPMKRQMVNREKLAFPSGTAAAETLRSLYGRSKAAIIQAYALIGPSSPVSPAGCSPRAISPGSSNSV